MEEEIIEEEEEEEEESQTRRGRRTAKGKEKEKEKEKEKGKGKEKEKEKEKQKEKEREKVDKFLHRIAKELTSGFIINSSDKTVRLYAALSLTHIFRIFAPSAPYDSNQLRPIFELLIQQLPGIRDMKGTYYKTYFELLQTLAAVKIFLLMIEEKMDDLIVPIFEHFFSSIM